MRCFSSARPSRKLPMKSITIGFPSAAKALFAGATPSTTAAAGPSRAVAASGSASVTQSAPTTAITAVRRRASSVAPGSGNAYASAASSAASASATNRRRAASMAPEYGGLGLLALLDLTHPALGLEVARIEAERLAQVLLGRLVVGLVQRQLAEDAVRAARGARLLEHALGAGADLGGGESAGVASLGTEVLEPGLEQPVLGLVGHALDGEPELAQRAPRGARPRA